MLAGKKLFEFSAKEMSDIGETCAYETFSLRTNTLYTRCGQSDFSLFFCMTYTRYEIYMRSELQIRVPRAHHQRPPLWCPGKVVKQGRRKGKHASFYSADPAILVDKGETGREISLSSMPVNDNGAVNGSSTIINGLDRGGDPLFTANNDPFAPGLDGISMPFILLISALR